MALTLSKAKKLKNLTVSKVSLVPAGSNPEANVTIFKSHPLAKATFDELRATKAYQKAAWDIYDATYMFQDAVYTSMYTEGGDAEIKKSAKQFGDYVEGIFKKLSEGAYEKADPEAAKAAVMKKVAERAARLLPQEETVKKTTPTAPTTAPATSVEKKVEDMSKEELLARVQELQKAQKTQEPAAKADPDDDDDENAELSEDVKKTLPPEVLAFVEKSEKASRDALTKASEAQKIAKEEQQKRRRMEFVDKVKKEIPNLPGSDEEKAIIVHTLYDTMPKEMADAAFEKMKAGDAAMAKAMSETGTDDSIESNAMATLEHLTDEVKKNHPTLTDAQAFDKAIQDNPAAYAEYRKENKRRSYASD